MNLNEINKKPFGFWIVNELLEPTDEPGEEPTSDYITLLAGAVLFVIIVLVGLFVRGHA
jgi:hypothetical protein